MSQDKADRIRTLLVGGAGFIGCHLTHELARDGRRQIAVLGRSAAPRCALPAGVRYLQGDARDPACIGPLLDDCDEVVDLAYATVPKTSFDDPVHDVVANLEPSVALLREAARRRLRKFVVVSSGGTVYGNAAYLPIDERHATNPVSPYGITKLAIEKYALMYQSLQGLPVVIVRPGNPYGPGQRGDLGQGFVGTAISSALNGRSISVFGERGTVRDYIYVEDLARGIAAALDSGIIGDIYNIGVGEGVDNLGILERLGRIARAPREMPQVNILPSRPFDVAQNVLSSARLTCISAWRPRVGLDDGLALTWNWAKAELWK